MNILLVEDESLAADRLSAMIVQENPQAEIVAQLDSIERTVDWLRKNAAPDLIFLDIQLADGLSFSIFSRVEVPAPVIFTTAFDQYVMDAFKVNSIDYLLKPIDPGALTQAFAKYEWLRNSFSPLSTQLVEELAQEIKGPNFKRRWLVKSGKELSYIPIQQIQYFYSEDGLTFLMSKQCQRCIVDYTIDQIEQQVDVNNFYRISRKFIVHIESIVKIQPYFSGRLKLELEPAYQEEVTVSRDRVNGFKGWLDQ